MDEFPEIIVRDEGVVPAPDTLLCRAVGCDQVALHQHHMQLGTQTTGWEVFITLDLCSIHSADVELLLLHGVDQ